MQREGIATWVHGYLDGDAAVREMIAAGVINYRALARWLIDMHGWDASEEAVVSALRRYPRMPTQGAYVDAQKLLLKSHINSRSNVWSLDYAQKVCVRDKIQELFALVDPSQGELLRIIEGDRAVKVVVTGQHVADVRELLRSCELLDQVGDLAEYSIVCPEQLRMTPGVLALIQSTLAVNKINIRESVSGAGELLVLVHKEDAFKAYQVLNRLCRPGVDKEA